MRSAMEMIGLAFALGAITACSDTPTVTPTERPLAIAGQLRNDQGQPLPFTRVVGNRWAGDSAHQVGQTETDSAGRWTIAYTLAPDAAAADSLTIDAEPATCSGYGFGHARRAPEVPMGTMTVPLAVGRRSPLATLETGVYCGYIVGGELDGIAMTSFANLYVRLDSVVPATQRVTGVWDLNYQESRADEFGTLTGHWAGGQVVLDLDPAAGSSPPSCAARYTLQVPLIAGDTLGRTHVERTPGGCATHTDPFEFAKYPYPPPYLPASP